MYLADSGVAHVSLFDVVILRYSELSVKRRGVVLLFAISAVHVSATFIKHFGGNV